MKCRLCGVPMKGISGYCSKRCATIVKLRAKATRKLEATMDKTEADDTSSLVIRKWLRIRLEAVSAGKEDARMLHQFSQRNKLDKFN